jgi:ribose 1,5-bisphosphate isomerase
MTFEATLGKIKRLEIQSSSSVTKNGLKSLAESIQKSKAKSLDELLEEVETKSRLLASARATEPALRNGLKALKGYVATASSPAEVKRLTAESVDSYIGRMEEAEERIAKIGEKRVTEGSTIMTHCHSRTVVAILKKAAASGKKFDVICTETRPRFQGRTTAKELLAAGIPTTMIVDSAARSVMNDVDLVMFGADAVTSDGFLVNKIGTSLIALAAKEARTMTCAACETFKFDPDTLAGVREPIEERDPKEVWDKPPKKLRIRNPAFDFTPPSLIDFVICEEGVISIQEASRIMKEKWG